MKNILFQVMLEKFIIKDEMTHIIVAYNLINYKMTVAQSDVTPPHSTQAVRVQIETRVWKKLLPFIRNSTLSPCQSLFTITTLLSLMK